MALTSGFMTWDQAESFWQSKPRAARAGSIKIDNNTVMSRDRDDFVITFHRCPIVRIHPYWPDTSGGPAWTLSGCGYRTRTTSERINAYAPISVYTQKGTWIAEGIYPSGQGQFERVEYLFEDGMVVNQSGMRIDDSAEFIEKKKARKNPSKATLHVSVEKHRYGTRKMLELVTDSIKYVMEFDSAPVPGKKEIKSYIDFNVFRRSGKPNVSVVGTVDDLGGIRWFRGGEATLDEYGSVIDQMLVWFFDQNMPPRGVGSAEYDVEI